MLVQMEIKAFLPGVVGVVVGSDGKEQFAYAAGKRGYGSSNLMTLETIFWIASCTKMITGLACMQLVERGELSLDDARPSRAAVPRTQGSESPAA